MATKLLLWLCTWLALLCGPSLASSCGKEFVTAFLTNSWGAEGNPKFELFVTGHRHATTITVTVNKPSFQKTISVNQGQTMSVQLPPEVEMKASDIFDRTVRVQADKEISVFSSSYKQQTAGATAVYPVDHLGTLYYVVTPVGDRSNSFKEFAVVAYQKPTRVTIHLKGTVLFKGHVYPSGSKLIADLQPFQTIQLQSANDLTGTRVQSNETVAVLSGHSCAQKFGGCDHVVEQLLPVSRWGTTFIVPPLSLQNRFDMVYIIASNKTRVNFQYGHSQYGHNMVTGQVAKFDLQGSQALFLSADAPIQVLFFFPSAAVGNEMYDPFLINIPAIESYCTSYHVDGIAGFHNYIIMVAKTSETSGITLDKGAIGNLRWRSILGTEYSSAEHSLGTEASALSIEHPDAPFGLFIFGVSHYNGYGSVALCSCNKPSCSSIQCRKKEKCEIKDGEPVCVPMSQSSCWAQGDPHYHTFDGRNFDFMGTCTYTIAKTCGTDTSLPSFSVEAKNENRGNPHVSYVGLVTVRVYNTTISVARGEVGYVRVNHQKFRLPISLHGGKLLLYQSGDSVFIDTHFSLTVSYDWNSYLVVKLSSSFSESLCGLCGNYNEDPADDFSTPNGTLASSAVAFGRSWRVEDGDRFCWDDCPGECKSCPPATAQKYEAEPFCGWISKADGGPFSQCHSVVDPKSFLDNCVYDLCLNDGLQDVLCEALKAYADACQKEGVTISDWRVLSGCLPRCPKNSHYEACGSPCPATCNGQAGPSNCSSLPCVETCQCNEGFVLDGGKCIPKASCGCVFEGKLFAPGEQFWGDSTCTRRCVCDPKSGEVACQATGCHSGEQCRVENGIQNCYPISSGTCSASGDPHYVSFDGRRFDFQGTCVYQYAGVCERRSGLVDFLVLVQNDHRGSQSVSFTRVVEITVYGASVVISRQYPGRVLVNGWLTNLPYSFNNHKVSIFRRGQEAVVQMDFFLTITYDWQSRVTVTAPSTYAGALCGLCGNFNGNQGDDLLMRDGTVAPTPAAFGQNWKVHDVLGCTDGVPGECPGLASIEAQQRDLKRECGLLLDQNGPFRECHGKVDPEGYFRDCVYDYCYFQGQQSVTCPLIASYAAACQAAGATVHDWRSDTFCRFPCAPNSHYELCAKGCAQTCSSIYVPVPCAAQCQEACVCDENFVQSGDRCVPLSQCGCYYQDRYYTAGETFYPSCQERCQCKAGGTVLCEAVSCGPHEECRLSDGVQKCHPLGGASCSASGDPHYLSFDGLAFDFQGTCTYILAAGVADNQTLNSFSVLVENEAWGNGKVSVTKMVSVVVYGISLTLRQNQRGEVQVNGLSLPLPAVLSRGRLRAYQHGTRVLMQTDFGLSVSYDLVYDVVVTLPSSFQGQVGGLCGNYNGRKDDDFRLPDGSLVTDATTFGAAWKILGPGSDPACSDGCSGSNCPECEESEKEVYKQRKYCGVLTADDGPFSACHDAVDPHLYLNNCVYDLCLGNGDNQVLCQSIESYVSACQEVGVSLEPWRTPSFCPLSCPANSHYELCADLCSTSCAKITDPSACPETCAEGCQCDDGFLFDGLGCVTAGDCGCFEDGRYYKPNVTVLLNGCQESCTCIPGRGLRCESHTCPPDERCVVQDGVMVCATDKPSCSSIQCRKKEKCEIKDGEPVCVPMSQSSCWAQGDPHYHTFDGRNFDFMGTCTYTIAKTCGPDTSLPSFSVEAKNENRGNPHVSYVGLVTVRVYNTTISVARGEVGYVRVNHQKFRLPISLHGGKLLLYQSGDSVFIDTHFSLTVSYDWNSYLVVKLSSSFSESLCGLCGNYNEDPADDFSTPNGTLASSAVAFGRSWRVEDGDRFCWDDCPGECKSCPPATAQKYEAEPFCGWISKADGGPFSQCHSVVDPKSFLDNCVYDLCLNDGLQDVLCEALKAYADACQKEGVTVSDWRVLSGCLPRCPENSHYEACGSPCPATCNGQAGPSNCSSLPCVETCQCNEGFVLDGGKCIPKASCGCVFEGKLFAPGEQFWGDSTCTRRCVCDPKSGEVACQATGCHSGEQCRVENGIQNCYPISSGTCSASGDPHYVSFDGRRFDFQGTCVYQYAGVCERRSGLVDFLVLVQNDHRGSQSVSFTRVVEITVYGASVVISRQYPGRVLVNGWLTNLPYSFNNHKVSIFRRGQEAVVQMDFFLTVTYDWQSRVTVTAPSTYAGALCGLCGNFNGNQGDDLLMRDGTVAPTPAAFGQNWKVHDVLGCTDGVPGECPGLASIEAQQRDLKRECGLLLDQNGPFRECHGKVDPEGYFRDCVYDYCYFQGQQSVTCPLIASYAAACQAAGATVHDWRSDTFCRFPCAPNSHYELCAKGCAQTCSSIYVPVPCAAQCQEACVCDENFVQSGDRCVPLSQCGCYYQDRYYTAGETFYPSCQERCQCKAGGTVLCEAVSCGPHEECRLSDGVQKCHPLGGASCSASGDPHYLSFDGLAFDFQGTCTYILAAGVADNQTLNSFSVLVENEAWGNGKVSVTKMVSVVVYGISLTLRQNQRGEVQVNGLSLPLPAVLSRGRLRAYQHGTRVLMQTDFGLSVSYDLVYDVVVTLPSSFQGQVGGLCGNYNGRKDDDFRLPDGSLVTDATTFGAAWKILGPGSDPACSDGCSGSNCPECEESEKEVYKQRKYCGVLTADDGPFSACHDAVDPHLYLNNCVYDLCLGNGDNQVLCQSIESYVSACQEVGVSLEPWRTPSFCPLSCPANSHYELCADLCSTSCAKITDPSACPETCAEGCQCDNGFLFDGLGCVTAGDCGCFEDGRYYKPNVTVLLNGCQESCTCIPGRGLRCESHTCPPDERCVVQDGVMVCATDKPSCSSVQCRKKEKCEIKDGEPVCVPMSQSSCWAQGDPHYHTFDGRNFDFMGTCTYTIAKTCGPDTSLPSFSVEAKNENRGNPHVSYVGLVTVRVYNTTISVARGEVGYVRVNHQKFRLPISLHGGKLLLYQSGNSIFIETYFSMTVSYDWNSYLVVKLSSSFSESLCGLCGNYNEDPADDFSTPNGTLASSAVDFGRSWRVEDGDRFCWDDCPGECKSCPPATAQKYEAEPFCGWISKADGGPFSQCHSVVDPKSFLDNCVYDLCLNDGLQDVLCEALKAYADACQKEGVTISDWRVLSGCLPRCPENSHYEACGSPCPATCNGQAGPSNCSSLPCVETCQCNEGFVLDGGKCIPKASCGCVFEGKLFAPGEQFWGDSTCTRRCVCDPKSGEVACQATGCHSGEQCRVENGIQNCYPISSGTCSASGDPHYVSFDGRRFDFQGTCVYQYAGVCERRSGLVDFLVLVQNDHRGSQSVSFTRVVEITVYGASVVISRQYPGRVLVNGRLTNLPYSFNNHKVSIFRRGQEAVVQMDFFLTVTFDWQSRVTVTVPSTYAGALCGLCGNFNGNQGDDLLMRDGTVAPTPAAFGQNWKVHDVLGCTDGVPGECPGLASIEAQQRDLKRECGLLLDQNGPFRECHGKVDPEGYFRDCVYDYCYFQGQQSVTCPLIASYAAACQAAGATVHDWRSDTFCRFPCAPNSHYELCAKGCAQTCSSIYVPVPCAAQCQEACVCDENFVQSGDRCVPLSQCGCYYQDRYYTAGETFYPSCQERCLCKAGGTVLCEAVSCGPHEECRLSDGVQKCHPLGGASCSASGDPHYLSFDGLAFDFQGTCTYILAAAVADNQTLNSFSVLVENEAWGNGKVSVTKMVSVVVYGISLMLRQNRRGEVQVNGLSLPLPAVLSRGRLRAYQHGTRVLMQTDFGLSVSYDLVYDVVVTVPSSFQGQVGGLCGNYNGRKDDDFQLPDGSLVTDATTFGAAWKILGPGSDPACSDGCSGSNCPECDERKKEVFKQRNYCGILTADDGPFSACHDAVDPHLYLNNCIYDLCLGNGENQVLCQSIESYVSACQEVGVSLEPWRTPSFCPLSCPANSHYELCADLCSTSCAKITDPSVCPETCAEGCQCDDGFFFDGLGCVTAGNCGCFEDGRYYKPHEMVLLNECQESCTCIPGQGVICKAHKCNTDEKCEIQDGVMGCINTDPCKALTCREKETCKTENNHTACVPDFTTQCWGWGDPHYHSFDGWNFDFQGTCTYTIAKYCGNDSTLVPFTIDEKNDNRGNQAVSYVSLTNIYVYGYKISIHKQETGRIRLNDAIQSLPLTLEDGKIKLFQSGDNAVLQTDFGLQATYDWNWHLILTLPSSYYGAMCGLCGNFNQNPEDDMHFPNGTKAPSIVSWASTWKVEDHDPFCWDSCQGTCPTCDENEQQQYGKEEFCGLIPKTSEGPFRECHAKVNPDHFFDSCVYDVCLNGGAKEFLCQALEAYAETCRKAGAAIQDWRTPSGCFPRCSENSHYEFCGTACPASCADRSAPDACQEPCVESCQCNEGFVLSVDKCVPVGSCGCTYNGFYYKPGEQFWADENCGSHCRCDPNLGFVVCSQAGCKPNEKCMVVNGIRDCYPLSYATCSASGDPHYTTFDGRKYDFMGTCVYQLVGLCSDDPTLRPFAVHVQNNNRGNKKVSYTKVVALAVYNATIVLSQDYPRRVQVNGIFENLPFNHEDKIKVYISGNDVVIQTDFDLTMTFDWKSYARVTVPNTYANAVCGLCGNNNQNPKDDLAMKNGSQATRVDQFGESWKVAEVPGCLPGCSDNCPVCGEAQNQIYQSDQYCGILIKKDGPFKHCHGTIDPATFFSDCVFDTCQYNGQQDTLCNAISSYVAACQAQGIPIEEWRSDSFCSPTCSRNSHYELCGNGCPATCSGLAAPAGCVVSCKEGCYCDAGFLLSGDRCVPIGDCGCVYQGKYYRKDEVFYPGASCQERCHCAANGAVECQEFSCGAHEECRVENGVQGCHPEGYGQCSVAGGSHYLTFDRRAYDFQGTCTYTLAQLGKLDSLLTNFSVLVENEGFLTKRVVVLVHGYTVAMELAMKWTVKVDGEFYTLPMSTNDGKLSANQEGNNIIILTDFGLKVLYDTSSYVLVSVPSTYQGHVNGLCGNFNGNVSDDFTLPSGKNTQDTDEFGASWKVPIDSAHCSDGCGEKCPVCDSSKTAPYRPESSCGMIQATSGPFKACHALVDPAEYFDNCLYDMCVADGAGETLCRSIQAYVAACQAAGITIEAWRSDSFCPLPCPSNSHYELCTRTCDLTCSSLSTPGRCTGACFEGCQCDSGYLFDGDRCVAMENCGCQHDGRYIQSGSSVILDDCLKNCTCHSLDQLDCVDSNCQAGDICAVHNGVRGCMGQDGECLLAPGARLTSFDGASGQVLYNGAYEVASLCDKEDPSRFRIVAIIQECRDLDVAAVSTLHIFFRGTFITVKKDQETWINGYQVQLPAQASEDIFVSLSPDGVVIHLGSQVQVLLRACGEVKVQVSASLEGKLCASCGNFNRNASDDLKLPNGNVAGNIAEVIDAWKAKDFSGCDA